MTKSAALYKFWAGFGLPAFEETSVPTGENAPQLPYITYEAGTDAMGEQLSLSASVWFRSLSWIPVNAKSQEISAAIGSDGIVIPCDGGYLWILRGSPFAQNRSDDKDRNIKRNFLNITVNFFTTD